MRNVILILIVLISESVFSASAYWNGLRVLGGSDGPDRCFYSFSGDVYGENGEHAWIISQMFGYLEGGALYLKHNDFSQEMMDATFNWWALADYGDFVDDYVFEHDLTHIKDFVFIEENDRYGDGTRIENPNDFYMAFKISEVLIEDYEYVEGMSWYGWVHVSIDENLAMTLLDSGINLTGGGVIVGAIPEPSSALFLLMGGVLLALQRRRSS